MDALFWKNIVALLGVSLGFLIFFWNRYKYLRDEQVELREKVAKLEERSLHSRPPKEA